MLAVGIMVVVGTVGELALSHTMKAFGDTTRLTPGALEHVVKRALGMPSMWAAVACMGMSFFAMVALLSWEDVSFVIPTTAASYPVGALGAKLFLHEQVNPARWIGVVLVSVGVVLIWMGR